MICPFAQIHWDFDNQCMNASVGCCTTSRCNSRHLAERHSVFDNCASGLSPVSSCRKSFLLLHYPSNILFYSYYLQTYAASVSVYIDGLHIEHLDLSVLSNPALGFRCHIAIVKASQTSCAFILLPMLQPTTLRE